MARPISYNRQAVLDQATELFWRRGYEATTLGDVLEATGFNRHSLYSEFGGKDGLFRAALRNYERTFNTFIGAALWSEDGGLGAIRNMFEMRIPSDVEGRGCLMTNTLSESEHVDDGARGCAGDFLDRLREGIAHAVRVAQDRGEVAPDRDPDVLALHVLSVVQGMSALSRAGLSEIDARHLADETLRYLSA